MKRLPSLTKKKSKTKIERNKDEVAFYKTYRWRRTSEQYRKTNPLCCMCEDEGRTKKANVVDHIKPIKEGGQLYDWNNLQSLCHKHHNKKTKQDIKKYSK